VEKFIPSEDEIKGDLSALHNELYHGSTDDYWRESSNVDTKTMDIVGQYFGNYSLLELTLNPLVKLSQESYEKVKLF
jgi:hypothetical protein